MTETLKQSLTATGVNQDDLIKYLRNVRDMVNELKTDYTALRADVTAIRTQVVALVADMATRITNHNTLATKLNADAGVTDVDYAAATAKTAVDPAAITATAIAEADLTLAA